MKQAFIEELLSHFSIKTPSFLQNAQRRNARHLFLVEAASTTLCHVNRPTHRSTIHKYSRYQQKYQQLFFSVYGNKTMFQQLHNGL